MAEDFLDNVKWVIELGAHTGLELLEPLARVRQFRVEFLGKCLVFSGLGGLWFDFVMARLGNPRLTLLGYSG